MIATRTARAGLVALSLVCALALVSCRTTKTLTGRVVDYDTRRPIAGASIAVSQSGWGVSGGGLVWDKTYPTSTVSDAQGAFTLQYTVGSSANLVASADGYSEFRHWYAPGRGLAIALKRLSGGPRLPTGFMHVGVQTDGRLFGWNFATAQLATDPDVADVMPTQIGNEGSAALDLSAGGLGGFRFVSANDLGVEDDFLVFADLAPLDGYARTISLDANGPAGVCFVRTADGAHYAKFAFTPNGFASSSGVGIRRSIDVPFVYNPSGERRLPFDRVPLPLGR